MVIAAAIVVAAGCAGLCLAVPPGFHGGFAAVFRLGGMYLRLHLHHLGLRLASVVPVVPGLSFRLGFGLLLCLGRLSRGFRLLLGPAAAGTALALLTRRGSLLLLGRCFHAE